MNRANVESHMEHYEAAIADFQAADTIEPNASCRQAVERIQERMLFSRQAFERAVLT